MVFCYIELFLARVLRWCSKEDKRIICTYIYIYTRTSYETLCISHMYVCEGSIPKSDYWTTGDNWGVLCNKWMVNSLLYFTVKSILQYCVCHKIPWRPCRLQNRVPEWTIQLLLLPRRLNCSNATGYCKFYKQHSFQCVATLFNIACLLLAQCWLWPMAPRLLEQNRSTFPSWRSNRVW